VAVLGERPAPIADVLSVATVVASGEQACGVLADIDDDTPVGDVIETLRAERWTNVVEADAQDPSIAVEYFAQVEGPWVISLARHFCPDQAVRLNLL